MPYNRFIFQYCLIGVILDIFMLLLSSFRHYELALFRYYDPEKSGSKYVREFLPVSNERIKWENN
jgi:hypothetical protein